MDNNNYATEFYALFLGLFLGFVWTLYYVSNTYKKDLIKRGIYVEYMDGSYDYHPKFKLAGEE